MHYCLFLFHPIAWKLIHILSEKGWILAERPETTNTSDNHLELFILSFKSNNDLISCISPCNGILFLHSTHRDTECVLLVLCQTEGIRSSIQPDSPEVMPNLEVGYLFVGIFSAVVKREVDNVLEEKHVELWVSQLFVRLGGRRSCGNDRVVLARTRKSTRVQATLLLVKGTNFPFRKKDGHQFGEGLLPFDVAANEWALCGLLWDHFTAIWAHTKRATHSVFTCMLQ